MRAAGLERSSGAARERRRPRGADARAAARRAARGGRARRARCAPPACPVTPDRSVTFARAASLLPTGDRDALYWAARLCFVTAPRPGRRPSTPCSRPSSTASPTRPTPRAATRARRRRRRARSVRRVRRALPARGGRRRRPARPRERAARRGDRGARRRWRRATWSGSRACGSTSSTRPSSRSSPRLVRRLALATPPRRGAPGARGAPRRAPRRARDAAAQPAHRRRPGRARSTAAGASGRGGSSRCSTSPGSMAPYARAYLLLLEGAARGARRRDASCSPRG